MGVYYIIVNHAKKEFIEPANIDPGTIKLPSMMAAPVARVVFLALTWMGSWEGDAIAFVDDSGDEDARICSTYTDVTKRLVDEYNKEAARFSDPDEVRAVYAEHIRHRHE